MERAIDGGTLRDNLTDIYGDGNRLVYLNDVLDLIDEQPTLTPPNEPLTIEELRASPHGKIKDSTLQSICNRANEIASRPPEGEEDT